MRLLLPALSLATVAGCTVAPEGAPYDVDQPLYEGGGPPSAADGTDGTGGTDQPADTTTTGGSAGDLPEGSPVYGTFEILSDFGSVAYWEFEGATVACSGCVWAFEGEFVGAGDLLLGWTFRDGGGDLEWVSYLEYYGSSTYWGPAYGDGAGRAVWERRLEDYYYGYYSYTYSGVVYY